MNFEDILTEVGEFGYYQKRTAVLYLAASALLLPFYAITAIFMISTPKHWCNVNQLANRTIDEQISLISPAVIDPYYGTETHDSCNMYDIDYNYFVTNEANISTYKSAMNISVLPVKPCSDGWSYDHYFYDNNAVTVLDLVCDRSNYVSLTFNVASIGTLVGTPFFGWLSDKIGRRRTYQITLFVIIATILSPTILRDLTSFLIFRGFTGLIVPSFYQLPFIILVELVGPSYRTLMNSVACIGWVIGMCFVPLVAYLTRDWALLNGICVATVAIFFCYWKLLPESPRWLIMNQKYTEAERQLQEMAKLNGRPPVQHLMEKLKAVGKSMSNENQATEKVDNALVVFLKNPILRRNLIIMSVNWMICSGIYYGIQMNVYNFSGNEFINFFLLSVVEIPAYLVGWFSMETRLGRRWTFALFMLLCGLSLCVPAITPVEYPVVSTVMAMLGKFCVTLTFMIVYQQGAELYPTAIRNQGLGIGTMASMVANIIMPYVVFLTDLWISLLVLGILGIIISFVSTILPETLNVNLPQTIHEGSVFGKNQKYFSFANTKSITKIADNIDAKELENLNAFH
ncbi:carcinine transporter-like [Oppia nitens]|uniref:carcinine transporter-like n=1 Tax=Oppia nitens TaxID=1686743 RepID=UPI0023DA429C|nr:carcinine transporter-like [Oppia nitens]